MKCEKSGNHPGTKNVVQSKDFRCAVAAIKRSQLMERKKFTARETRLANWTNKFDFFYGQMIPDWKRMRFGFNEIIL